jgi:phosphomannomutase
MVRPSVPADWPEQVRSSDRAANVPGRGKISAVPIHPEPTRPVLDGVDRLPLPAATRAAIAAWPTSETGDERTILRDLVARALSGPGAEASAALAELEDAFAGPLPIGTGGRRGPCGPGPNRVNDHVMRETALGLWVAMQSPEFGSTASGSAKDKVAIVFDTRATSRRFAGVAAQALGSHGVEVLLIDEPRPTPQLSFLVRQHGCGAGVVITASHNPPTDNGIKVYGPDGAQVLGARDRVLMEAIIAGAIELGTKTPRITTLSPEQVDPAYLEHVLSQGVVPGSLADSGLVASFSPLHGVGHSSVLPVLRARGLEPIVVEAQLPDDGRFETLASANPEAPAAFARSIELAQAHRADLCLATDPDADRLGAVARTRAGELEFIDGNRLGVLMLDHVLRSLAAVDHPSLREGWVLTTLVTSPLIAKLARAHGVEVVDDLLVGFKYHAGAQAEGDPRPLIFACEESHGYLRGNEIRDKDGAIAALLLCESAAACKRADLTFFDRLTEIWRAHGYHRERTGNLYAEGGAGRRAIGAVMQRLREQPPTEFAGLAVIERSDRSQPRSTGSPTRDLLGDVLTYELAGSGRGARLVFRPSGTEPKIKVYVLAHGQPGLEGQAAVDEQHEVDALIGRVLAEAEARASVVMRPLLERA